MAIDVTELLAPTLDQLADRVDVLVVAAQFAHERQLGVDELLAQYPNAVLVVTPKGASSIVLATHPELRPREVLDWVDPQRNRPWPNTYSAEQVRQRLFQQALAGPQFRQSYVLHFLDHVQPINCLVHALANSHPAQQRRLVVGPGQRVVLV